MITTRRRGFVSIAATIAMTLALGACASTGAHSALDRPVSKEDRLLSIRFDNASRERVDVYLIGANRQWMLGRVAPGAVARLTLPEEAFLPGAMRVRLAVLAGQPETFDATRDPHTVFTVAQSASALLTQYWTFSASSLTSLQY
ncbi:MAG: hypothetical protein ACJ79Q_09470 [Gemmatimonadaceae bacterium]|jgi:hypothetical protein